MQAMMNEFSDNYPLLGSDFEQQTGLKMEQLLEPISSELPSGVSLRENGVYNEIKTARTQDDPNLPLGVWQHDLKQADWEKVVEVSLRALSDKTKDLQILVWFLEAQIHRHGFAGIAPAVFLMSQVVDKFWDDIHPQMIDGDIEYRTNLVVWLNNKLQPTIRQLPITQYVLGQEYSWFDWERAIQLDQMATQDASDDYPTTKQISHAIANSSADFYRALYQDLCTGIASLDVLDQVFESRCHEQSPPLKGIRTLLEDIRETLVIQLKPRGVVLSEILAQQDDDTQGDQEGSQDSASQQQSIDHPGGGDGSETKRQRAYRMLSEAAELLLQDDPHSPVPYLIIKAIDWGQLNTAELYQELFVRYQGQLNIFDLLGIELPEQGQQ